jgi:hypothetical protein
MARAKANPKINPIAMQPMIKTVISKGVLMS